MAEKRSALVVATSQYEDARLAPLAGPGRDAQALEKVLGDAEIGGFDVQLALNTPLAELRTTLDSFFADAARDDLLLVHFSGHGLKDDDGQLYLAAADTRIDRLLSTAVEASWVNKLMAKCRSEKIALFLDCCFGGAFTAGLTRRAGVDTAGSKETFSGSGRFVITASDAMQYSFEGGQLVEGTEPEPSPFTRALVEGLTTGEADRNDDGFVSINELFDYLEDRVRQLSPAQTPTKSAFNQVGDWVIAQSMRAPTIRILPASLQEQLKSDTPIQRMQAAFVLKDLIQGGDPRTAEAAQKALERLTGDDSRLVAEAAERLFGRTPSENQVAGTVTSTPLSEADLPPVLINALGGTVAADPPAATPPEPANKVADPIAPATGAVQPPAATLSVAGTSSVTGAATGPARAAQSEAAPTPAQEPARTPWAPPVPPPTPPPSAGPLWGPATGVAPPPVVNAAPLPVSTTVAGQSATRQPWVAPSGAAGRGWTAVRAFGRGALGTAIGLLLSYFYYVGTNEFASTSNFGSALGAVAVIAAVVGGIIAAIEKIAPPLRVPDGAAYRIVGNNRWVLAVVLGAILGTIWVAARNGYTPEDFILFVIGYLVAEAVVGRKRSSAPAASA
jgi:uncharacterized caspase-like protein